MYKAIAKFFALHHHLALPGIGNFAVETIPAQIDFTNRSASSSHKKIIFTTDKKPAEKKFYDFLSYEFDIDEVQAVRRFTDFTAQLHDELNDKKTINFKGIGAVTKQSSNTIIFSPEELPEYYPPLTAERIIRKNISHTVRVGEDEKTSDEMQTALHKTKIIKKERWWIAATILAFIGIAAITFYYVTHR